MKLNFLTKLNFDTRAGTFVRNLNFELPSSHTTHAKNTTFEFQTWQKYI